MLGLKKIAAMVILRHADQYLLLKRNKEPNRNTYVPVGGKLEPFETPRSAAIRETYEETGIEIEHLHFCGTLIESSPTKYNWMCYIYLADIDWIEAPFCDEGTLEWIKHCDLNNIPTPPTDSFIYEYVQQSKPFAFSAIFSENLEMLEMREEIENNLTFIQKK